MGKAILVMDMPEKCASCELYDCEYDFCIPSNNYVRSFEKPSLCPLKPMPENKDAMTAHFATDYNYALGWNDCLDAIQGKE